jgi:hypothetical protein
MESSWGVTVLMRKEGSSPLMVCLIGKIPPGQFNEKDALITAWRILPISILEGRLNDVKKKYSPNGCLWLSKSVGA